VISGATPGRFGATDPALTELIVTRIVELAKDGVYDIEELSSRTLSSLKSAGWLRLCNDRIPIDGVAPPAYLLRESYREDGKVKKRTLANITHWPAGKMEALSRLLRDEYAPHEPSADLKLMGSLPHGHVAAALGMLRKLGLRSKPPASLPKRG
jgi:hypothetical protein